MKKKIITVTFSLTLLLLLLASIAGANTVQAYNSFYNKDTLPIQLMNSEIIAAAHWNETIPVQGGWIFATLTREPGYGNDAYLYVSGYHPPEVTGPTNVTFSGSNSTVKLTVVDNVISVKTTINFTMIKPNLANSYALHDVELNWTLPTTANARHGYDWNKFYVKNTWSDTVATADINLHGTVPHTEFSTSDWATLAILKPQKEVSVAHWIADSPKAGGWVFAAAGKDDDRGRDAWLYVAGYHPANAFGKSSATIFEALNTTDVTLIDSRNAMIIPTITLNFTQQVYATDIPTTSFVLHDVSVNWTAIAQPNLHSDWRTAGADLSINTGGTKEHVAVSTSSWAITDLPTYVFTLGNTNVGSYQDGNDANAKSASYFMCSYTGTVTDILAYIASAGNSGISGAAIYADNNGSPGALIAATDKATVSSAFSWVDFHLTSSVSVTAGTGYWLAISSDNGLNMKIVVGSGVRTHNGVSSWFSDPFGPIWGTHDAGAMSIYATGTTK